MGRAWVERQGQEVRPTEENESFIDWYYRISSSDFISRIVFSHSVRCSACSEQRWNTHTQNSFWIICQCKCIYHNLKVITGIHVWIVQCLCVIAVWTKCDFNTFCSCCLCLCRLRNSSSEWEWLRSCSLSSHSNTSFWGEGVKVKQERKRKKNKSQKVQLNVKLDLGKNTDSKMIEWTFNLCSAVNTTSHFLLDYISTNRYKTDSWKYI